MKKKDNEKIKFIRHIFFVYIKQKWNLKLKSQILLIFFNLQRNKNDIVYLKDSFRFIYFIYFSKFGKIDTTKSLSFAWPCASLS